MKEKNEKEHRESGTRRSSHWEPIFRAAMSKLGHLIPTAFALETCPQEVAALERVHGALLARVAGHIIPVRVPDALLVLDMLTDAIADEIGLCNPLLRLWCAAEQLTAEAGTSGAASTGAEPHAGAEPRVRAEPRTGAEPRAGADPRIASLFERLFSATLINE